MAQNLLAAALGGLAVFIALPSGVARADGAADEADLHFQIGTEVYYKGDFRSALEHFLMSNRLVPNRNVVFNIARTYEQLKRYADAYRYYVDALDGQTDKPTIASINDAIKRIGPNVAVLRIESDPPGAVIYLDRKDLGSRGRAPKPLAVPEGNYKVIVELHGYDPVSIDGVIAKNGSETRVRPVLRRVVGTVAVAVEGAPGATVHVDDEKDTPICTAPCSFELPPGQHLLHFSRDGFQTIPQQVTVSAKGTVKTVAKMSPLTGSAVIQADERDAIVEIDGKASGFTPAVIQGVPVGKRKVTITLRGYAPVERVIEIKAGQQTQLLDIKLIPLRQVAAASRFTQSIDDAPSSITVIDGQELRAFGYPTLWEALRGVRGVALSNDRTYQSVAIRGLGEPNDYGNRMLVLQDGAVLNDNLLNSTYIGSDGRPDLQDIERIEVVRGPGSLLYGANAMSGVVNMVPRPRDEPSSVRVSGGTYDNAVLHARAGFHYNLTSDMGVFGSFAGSRSDGFSTEVSLKDPPNSPAVVADRVDFHRAYGTEGRFWAGPLTVQWYYNQNKHRVPIGAYGTVFNDSRTFLFDERFLGELRYEPQLTGSLQLLLRAHANHYNYNGEYAFDDTGVRDEDLFIERLQGTWYGGEGRLVWTPLKNLRVTAGGDVQVHVKASIVGDFVPEDGPYVNEHHRYRAFAPYAVGDWGATSWLRVSGGIRYDHFDYDEPIKDIGTPVFRAAVIVKPTSTTVVKLMGGSSFRAPSIYEQFYWDGGSAQVKATDLEKGFFIGPETIYTGELEVSQRFLENWSILGSGWVSRIDDIINSLTVDPMTGVPDPGSGTQRYVNSSEPALIVGADLEVRHEWRQGWFFSGFYSYQRAQYLAASDNVALKQNPRLVNAPAHLSALRGVVPVVPELASLGGRVTIEAPRRISRNSDAMTGTSVTADITLSGDIRRLGLGYVLGLYNIADQRYDYINAASYLSELTRQNGRTVLFNLSLQYP